MNELVAELGTISQKTPTSLTSSGLKEKENNVEATVGSGRSKKL